MVFGKCVVFGNSTDRHIGNEHRNLAFPGPVESVVKKQARERPRPWSRKSTVLQPFYGFLTHFVFARSNDSILNVTLM